MLKKYGRLLLAAAAALVLAGVAYKGWRILGQPVQPAPALAGIAVDGRPVDLVQSTQRTGGKPVMVVFWATWCPGCLEEQPIMKAIARDYEIIGVAWRSEDDASVATHMAFHGLSYATLNDVDGTLSKRWGVRGVPAHFIVRPDGMTRFRANGEYSEWALRTRLWWASTFHD
jgi:thiol-disulfide isomerase/thioredoxin